MITFQKEIQVIHSLMQTGEKLYLVGGAVRDAILTRQNQDLDFVCTADPRIIGRKLAEKLSGAFFMLDDERNACRVIAKNDQGVRLVYDFTQMRGLTLEEDLRERDFNINAMAVDLDNTDEVIDPLKGRQDLDDKCLRLCKTSSFRDDPLRVIRAIRYSVKYGLKLEPSTVDQLILVVSDLGQISRERKRDELFKILELENPSTALKFLADFQILPHLGLDMLSAPQIAFTRLDVYFGMISILTQETLVSETEITNKDQFVSIFSSSRKKLLTRLCQVNQSERSIKALVGLTALLWDHDEIEGLKAAETLALSREEQEQISLSLRYKCCILDHFSSQKSADRRFIYRYFQVLGIAGIDVALLTLVDVKTEGSSEMNAEEWGDLVRFCHGLIEAWFVHPEYVNPKLLLTGRDLMFEFDIPQGPRIGQLLDGLREEQAIGTVQNRTQAMAWVDGQIQKGFISG